MIVVSWTDWLWANSRGARRQNSGGNGRCNTGVDPYMLASVIQKFCTVLTKTRPFAPTTCPKDLQLYAAAAHEQHVPVLVGGTVSQMYEVAKAQDKGSWNSSAVCTTTEKQVG
ncbi:hypothetical protein P4U99_17415 [Brevibacillus agri]|uniref:hypothetical protein n=2 Tax=Brevibacillus agri TaxID=51101 RepID=UPI002E21C526|nr:hypothetical protein [Brevibacillus agri]MED1653940.1 hypothetical protein [Brevibacillus agri]MED1685490.1 hypothetical protein [Brevibacillus agri]MED1692801.1 hypothetical protein [Brevibacillus agri]MED1697119.1 hypothetical protein [Brevibacillus agri]